MIRSTLDPNAARAAGTAWTSDDGGGASVDHASTPFGRQLGRRIADQRDEPRCHERRAPTDDRDEDPPESRTDGGTGVLAQVTPGQPPDGPAPRTHESVAFAASVEIGGGSTSADAPGAWGGASAGPSAEEVSAADSALDPIGSGDRSGVGDLATLPLPSAASLGSARAAGTEGVGSDRVAMDPTSTLSSIARTTLASPASPASVGAARPGAAASLAARTGGSSSEPTEPTLTGVSARTELGPSVATTNAERPTPGATRGVAAEDASVTKPHAGGASPISFAVPPAPTAAAQAPSRDRATGAALAARGGPNDRSSAAAADGAARPRVESLGASRRTDGAAGAAGAIGDAELAPRASLGAPHLDEEAARATSPADPVGTPFAIAALSKSPHPSPGPHAPVTVATADVTSEATRSGPRKGALEAAEAASDLRALRRRVAVEVDLGREDGRVGVTVEKVAHKVDVRLDADVVATRAALSEHRADLVSDLRATGHDATVTVRGDAGASHHPGQQGAFGDDARGESRDRARAAYSEGDAPPPRGVSQAVGRRVRIVL